MTAKHNFFKTPTSVRLVQVGPCPLPLEYQAATSHTGRQPCQAKSLYMKRFWYLQRTSTDVTVAVFDTYSIYSTCTVGYNDFDFYDKMGPPRPEMDAKWDSKTHFKNAYAFFQPFCRVWL
jgi:hypothetical protein